MRRLLRAYPTLLRVGLSSAIAYRAEFIVWMLTMTMPLVMLAITTAVARDAPLGRFGPGAFTGYYLATLIVRQMSGSWVVWQMIQEIKEGTLSLRLLRPIHPVVSFSAESLAAIPMRLVVALPLAVLAVVFTGANDLARDPVLLGLFVVALMGAWLLNFAVSALVGVLGLFLESSLAVWELWLGGFMLFSGYLLSLELFPAPLEKFARALPFAYLQAVPVEILTGLHDRTSALRLVGWQYLYGAGAIVLLLYMWRRGIKRFQAFGG